MGIIGKVKSRIEYLQGNPPTPIGVTREYSEICFLQEILQELSEIFEDLKEIQKHIYQGD